MLVWALWAKWDLANIREPLAHIWRGSLNKPFEGNSGQIFGERVERRAHLFRLVQWVRWPERSDSGTFPRTSAKGWEDRREVASGAEELAGVGGPARGAGAGAGGIVASSPPSWQASSCGSDVVLRARCLAGGAPGVHLSTGRQAGGSGRALPLTLLCQSLELGDPSRWSFWPT